MFTSCKIPTTATLVQISVITKRFLKFSTLWKCIADTFSSLKTWHFLNFHVWRNFTLLNLSTKLAVVITCFYVKFGINFPSFFFFFEIFEIYWLKQGRFWNFKKWTWLSYFEFYNGKYVIPGLSHLIKSQRAWGDWNF